MSDPLDGDTVSHTPLTPWLLGLNAEQRLAVETTEGPVLVLSGAGTGKTRVLTSRLAHILMTKSVRPWQCLAVTFTNRAAREMRERTALLVGEATEQVWLGTFHALGARILRRHAPLAGLNTNFTILDPDDQLRLLKQILEEQRIDTREWPAPRLMNRLQRWKDQARSPEKLTSADTDSLANGRLPEIYRLYQERLRALNACDFGDLLLHGLTLFQNEAAVLQEYQEKFRYILVDEYQDTNIAQYLWLRLLTQKHKNLCCVGDDDQSIYSWRGAEVGNILKFERDFPGAKVIRLEANYRSTPPILAAASGLIAHNEGRLGKTLRPGLSFAEDSPPVSIHGVWDGEKEARWAVQEIESLRCTGESLREISILVRAGFQTRAFEERMIATALPYRVVGGLRFYERQEIRDALAYFRVVVQPADDLAFERILNVPKRGLGTATFQALYQTARHQGIPMLAAARLLMETEDLKPKARSTLQKLIADFDRWRQMLDGVRHAELADTILEESGYAALWRKETSPDAQGRRENLKELVTALNDYPSLPDFLEHVSLVMENEDDTDSEHVTLMTLHAAKGLEFDVVFLPGWEEGMFPHPRALEESGLKGLEEERRLAYVGLTRARKRAYISYAAQRLIYNQWQTMLPSRFIEELPGDAVERHVDTGIFGSVRSTDAWQTKAQPAKKNTFRPGIRVLHEKFGAGYVIRVDGSKLEIAFDTSGIKKVLDSFVSLA